MHQMFQSTLPCEGATAKNANAIIAGIVSIHAPVRGSDSIVTSVRMFVFCFNPRSRARERL